MNKRAKIAVLSVSCVYVVVWFLVTDYAANAYVSSRFAAQQEQARQQVSLAKSTLEAILSGCSKTFILQTVLPPSSILSLSLPSTTGSPFPKS